MAIFYLNREIIQRFHTSRKGVFGLLKMLCSYSETTFVQWLYPSDRSCDYICMDLIVKLPKVDCKLQTKSFIFKVLLSLLYKYTDVFETRF